MVRTRGSTDAPRRGFLLVEIAAASLALAIAMTVTVQVVGWFAAERRATDRRERAVQEAANAMERLTARPWDALTPEVARAERLDPSAQGVLPGGELLVELSEEEGGEARRIGVQVRWRGRTGAFEAPVRLTSWTYRRAEGRP